MDFVEFPKIARLNREMIVTEKIDGTNAQVRIPEIPGEFGEGVPFLVGSRSRWITPGDDNFGFAKWCFENAEELLKLGPGSHFGEWWGKGIQRQYGQATKKFSLFNVGRWALENVPSCCGVVPLLYKGAFDTNMVSSVINTMRIEGSTAAPGFMNPEGVVVFHVPSQHLYKVTCEKDESPKGKG